MSIRNQRQWRSAIFMAKPVFGGNQCDLNAILSENRKYNTANHAMKTSQELLISLQVG